jgi:hypothetical protein
MIALGQSDFAAERKKGIKTRSSTPSRLGNDDAVGIEVLKERGDRLLEQVEATAARQDNRQFGAVDFVSGRHECLISRPQLCRLALAPKGQHRKHALVHEPLGARGAG